MRIKGVAGGKRRGEPVEFSAEEKVPLALQDAFVLGGPEQSRFPDCMVSIAKGSVQLTKVDTTLKGEKLKGQFSHNNYAAEGTAKLNLRHMPTNTARPSKEIRFKVKFCDCLDGNGLPDFKLNEITIR